MFLIITTGTGREDEFGGGKTNLRRVSQGEVGEDHILLTRYISSRCVSESPALNLKVG